VTHGSQRELGVAVEGTLHLCSPKPRHATTFGRWDEKTCNPTQCQAQERHQTNWPRASGTLPFSLVVPRAPLIPSLASQATWIWTLSPRLSPLPTILVSSTKHGKFPILCLGCYDHHQLFWALGCHSEILLCGWGGVAALESLGHLVCDPESWTNLPHFLVWGLGKFVMQSEQRPN
jgi:hypothetical protein